jgi:hypothetical protein
MRSMVDVWELTPEAMEGAEPLGTMRLGDTRQAPASLGSRKLRVIEPAPGAYVRGLEPSRG